MDSQRLNFVVGDEAIIKEKHQGLLQEYLVLQKECVAKKRKLKEAKDRKLTLLDEIRFLKHRRTFLLKKRSLNVEQQEVMQHKTDAKSNVQSSRTYMNASASASANAGASTSGQAFQNHRPPMIPVRNSGSGKEDVAFASLNSGKMAKKLVMNGKRAEKRKISWQDQLALKA